MTTITSLRAQVAALAAAAAQPRRAHRRTTAEGRQELARILDHLDGLPPDAPTFPQGLPEAYAEIDRALAMLDARQAGAS